MNLLISVMMSMGFLFAADKSIMQSRTFSQEGRLVSVQIVMGEPVRIFVTGREEAKLDLNDLKLTIRRIKPYPGKVLDVKQRDDYFELSDQQAFRGTSDLEVKTKLKGETETMRFNLNHRAP